MRGPSRRPFTVAAWSCLWIVLFWTFLVIGFPAATAGAWLAGTLARAVGANVSIERARLGWNLAVRLEHLSVARRASAGAPPPGAAGPGDDLTIVLGSVDLEPRLVSLLLAQPEIGFSGATSSRGSLSGSYRAGDITLSFSGLSPSDVTIGSLPLPATARLSGGGRLRLVTSHGTIETEIDGIPGGTQRLRVSSGNGPGFEGTLRISVSALKS